MSNILTYLNIAKFAQIAYAEREANELAFKGTFITPQYSKILSLTIQAIQARYNKLPNDPTLQPTGDFMYALSGGVNTTPNTIGSPLKIILQPNSATVTENTNVSFSVAVADGVAPYFYQWYFNGNPIGGATNSSLTLSPAILASAGQYLCKITDSVGAIVTSNPANLVVNPAAILGSYYYGSTDYFTALSGGTDTITYQGTFPITHNANFSIPFPIAADNDLFEVIRVPVGAPIKTGWFVTSFDNGSIPDSVFRAALQPVGLPLYTYYLTRITSSHDFTNPLILS